MSTNSKVIKMSVKEGFRGGFLVLGFVIFIVGFLAGILAVALIPVKPDFTTLGFMVFIFGFITGMVTVSLVLVIVKLTELTKNPPSRLSPTSSEGAIERLMFYK